MVQITYFHVMRGLGFEHENGEILEKERFLAKLMVGSIFPLISPLPRESGLVRPINSE